MIRGLTSSIRCLAVAKAIATPSCVLVPLPSSSMMTRLRQVALAMMSDASRSSDMKVLRFLKMSSEAPILGHGEMERGLRVKVKLELHLEVIFPFCRTKNIVFYREETTLRINVVVTDFCEIIA